MKKKSFLIETIRSVLFAVLLVFIVNKWFFKPVEVVGISMYPTLKNGEKGFSNIVVRHVEGIKRFDIVVVKTKQYGLIVKRVIGLPNDTVEIKDETLYINNQKTEQSFLNKQYIEDYKKQHQTAFDRDVAKVQLAKDQYFLMGDNRPYSLDSRSDIGVFHQEDIISKDMMVMYPFNEIKYIGR